MTNYYLQIGSLMEKHGFTNQSLADASGVPKGTISGIRSGQIQNPGFDAVCAMMKAMGESVDALIGLTPPPMPVDEEKLTADGYTESEKKVILRWAGSEIARRYQAVVASLEARLSEKDVRLAKYSDMIAAEQRRAQEMIHYERRRARTSTAISYIALGLWGCLFIVDWLMPDHGWILR